MSSLPKQLIERSEIIIPVKWYSSETYVPVGSHGMEISSGYFIDSRGCIYSDNPSRVRAEKGYQ